MTDFFANFLTTFTAFNKVWAPEHLKYGLMSSIVNAAHCDGELLKYSLEDRFASDYSTSCGKLCRTLMQQFDGPVATAFKVNPIDHTQVIVFASNHTGGIKITAETSSLTQLFVSFRGTQAFDIVNHRRNFYFKFWPVSLCAGCEAHKGFWRNFVSLRPELAVTIGEVSARIAGVGTTATFLTTGMSMGAPLASLAGYHLKMTGYTPKGVVTFGSPRVGNYALASAITSSFVLGIGSTGFAYIRDPVPHLPPRVLGYRTGQAKLFHIAIKPEASVKSELGENYDIDDYLLYSDVYENTAVNKWQGDKQFAGATYTYALSDHFGYFMSTVQFEIDSCGVNSEAFIKNDKATELFFI